MMRRLVAYMNDYTASITRPDSYCDLLNSLYIDPNFCRSNKQFKRMITNK